MSLHPTAIDNTTTNHITSDEEDSEESFIDATSTESISSIDAKETEPATRDTPTSTKRELVMTTNPKKQVTFSLDPIVLMDENKQEFMHSPNMKEVEKDGNKSRTTVTLLSNIFFIILAILFCLRWSYILIPATLVCMAAFISFHCLIGS